MNDILVSITTVTFNSEKTIKRTIESVLNQTYRNIEYIIVDGLSTDKTLDIVYSYKKKFQDRKIKYFVISEKDNGIYDAINKGIKLATGTIIGNVNSDDYYELDCIENVVKCYNETNFDFMYGNLRCVYENGKERIKKAKEGLIVTSRYWNHPTQFATKKLYMNNLYKCHDIYDDFNLYCYIMKHKDKYNIVRLNKVLSNFTLNGISHKKDIKSLLYRIKIRYDIYKNNGYNSMYILECIYIELVKFFFG